MQVSSGFWSTIQQGDAVTLGVALLLLLMSVLSWVVLLFKLVEGWRERRMARNAQGWRQFNAAQRQAWRQGAEADDPYAMLHDLAWDAVRDLRHMGQHAQGRVVDGSEWITRRLQLGLDRSWMQAQKHLTVLASVGATAPFVGLLGTVWGIYHALAEIGQSGLASIDQVAGPVGEALVMTALGLAVAIPAVLSYNGLVRAAKNRLATWREFAVMVHAHAITGAWEEA
ncbi:MAG: MotA/TolQ/ExbB proton channel family protein [Alphaproteobacteria bacterium]|nr:MotA/TolQ/ExbB proton channel family protein [Alphaproteobacteria bacterium]